MSSMIIAVATQQDIAPAQELVDETGLDVEVVLVTEEKDISTIRTHFEDETGVVIARGRLASRLKAFHEIPVIDVVLSGQDMAELMEKACQEIGHPHPHIAFIGQRYMFSNPEAFARILEADVEIYYVGDEDEIDGVLIRAHTAGVECVIGDASVCLAAQKSGFCAVYIGPARNSLLSALRTATRLSDALRMEQRRRKDIQYLIQYSSDAIISLNDRKEIISANPRAEKALGMTASELIGKSILEIDGFHPSSSFMRALESSQPTYSIVLQFGKGSFVANITPVTLEEKYDGWLISMQEFAAIDDLDERIRQERKKRGYIARAHFSDFPSRSPAIQPILEEAEAYASYDVPILITGEPRLPKSRLAECIHNASLRRRNPYVAVDLGTIPPESQFDILFCRHGGGDIGLVGQAHKGTLFMLDVHTLTPECQRQLLSLIRNNYFRRKDSLEPIPVSVRIICSTFLDLAELARKDQWMWQLANTLLGLSLHIPPIREMPEDIPAYVQEYMDLAADKFKKRVTLTDEVIAHLSHYPWPNNLRDIEYFALRATMLAKKPTIDLEFVRDKLLPDLVQGETEQAPHIVADQEELAIRRLLRETGGSRQQTAEALGISRSTLWRKIRKYGLSERDHYT